MALPAHFWKKAFLLVCIILACLVVGFILGRCERRKYASAVENEIMCDTVTYFDTVKYLKPIPKEVLIARYDTVMLPTFGNEVNFPTNDTIQASDSVSVIIPISQSVYQDSTYTAWVSGYHASLDSIYVFPQHDVITIKEYKLTKRWHLGVSVGYGITPKGLQPWLGLGVTYTLFDF
jgi:hypothetical protein